ncbi:hypothetical protein M5D96_009094 [Drosophila gunungcola]|uniref:Secreted protein n=1 Tax=Drosophila gunungcola TaxID=103775 RepID=A0A9P9YJT4_9MUSC|nr:hypothetical protein M5D96_009094 [Drosophila gunungcola]
MRLVICTVLPLFLSRSFSGIPLTHSRTHVCERNTTLTATSNSKLAPACRHLTSLLNPVVHFNVELKKRPQSWASTPDIDEPDDAGRRPQASTTSRAAAVEDHNVAVTVKLPVPPRRHTTALDIKEVRYG